MALDYLGRLNTITIIFIIGNRNRGVRGDGITKAMMEKAKMWYTAGSENRRKRHNLQKESSF